MGGRLRLVRRCHPVDTVTLEELCQALEGPFAVVLGHIFALLLVQADGWEAPDPSVTQLVDSRVHLGHYYVILEYDCVGVTYIFFLSTY